MTALHHRVMKVRARNKRTATQGIKQRAAKATVHQHQAMQYKKVAAAVKKAGLLQGNLTAAKLKNKMQEAEPEVLEDAIANLKQDFTPAKAETVIKNAAEAIPQVAATSGYGGWISFGLGLLAIIGGIVCAATGYGALLSLPLISAGIGLVAKSMEDKKVAQTFGNMGNTVTKATTFFNAFEQKAAAVATPKLAAH